MSVAGYSTTVQISSDSSTLTNEACSQIIAGSKYQITTAAHRVLDPTVAIVVKDNGSTVGATLYTIDYLTGTITFSGYSATGPVTLNGAAKNLVTLIDAKSVSEEFTAELTDRTVFASAGVKTRQVTLQDYSAELSALTNSLVDQDPGTATQRLYDLWANRTPVLLVIMFPTDSAAFRAWVVIESITNKSQPGALDEMTIKVVSAPQQGNGRTDFAAFSYA